MQSILLPTDFSDCALNAIHYSIALFKKAKSTFYLVHAYQMAPSAVDSKVDCEKKLEDLRHQLVKCSKGALHHFETILIMDALTEVLGRVAIDKDVDFIIMGTKGSSEIKEIFLGSGTVSTVKRINFCPILAIPKEYQYEDLEEILLVTDFGHFYEKAEMTPLLQITKLTQAALVVVHISEEQQLNEVQKKSRELLKSKLEGVPHLYKEVPKRASISQVVNQLTRENPELSMIVMLKRKHGFFARLFRESVIQKVVFRTKVPFLVLPEME